MNGKSREELLDSGYKLSQIAHDVYIHESLLSQANIEGTSEKQLIDLCLNKRRNKEIIPNDVLMQKHCTYYGQCLHINEFSAQKDPRYGLRFSSLSLRGDNERSKLRVKEFNHINYPIIRLWFHGDEHKKLQCLVTKQDLENISEPNESIGETRTYNLFELHHILTINGLSVHKIDINVQPSYLLGKRDLTLPQNKADLIDLMNTVCISPNEHTKVHCSSRKSDMAYWSARNAIPWGLQSEDNFKFFCNKIPHLNLDYWRFLDAQTLEWYEQHEKSIDLNKNPQDIQEYLKRFE